MCGYLVCERVYVGCKRCACMSASAGACVRVSRGIRVRVSRACAARLACQWYKVVHVQRVTKNRGVTDCLL